MGTIGFASWIFCTTGWFPFSRGTGPNSITPVTVVNPLGGLLDVWSRASPAMVFVGTSADPVPLRPILSRFRVARTVRCQRTYWAKWQERLASFSHSCPHVAASMVLRTFSSPSEWITRIVSRGFFPLTSQWPRMSVPPIGASISLPLAPFSQSVDDKFFLAEVPRHRLSTSGAWFVPSEL